MQKVIFKFLLFTVSITTITLSNSNAESTESELFKADSLYENSQYTQAIKIYNNLFQQGYYSPNMLLKLARLAEGQAKYGLSIYYLEKFYQLTADENAIVHIEKLAEEHALRGFTYDLPYYLNIYYKKYNTTVVLLLLFLTIILFAWAYWRQTDKTSTKKIALFALVLLVTTAFFNNYNGAQYGILTELPTYAMSGPSAASNVQEIIESPTKILIQKSTDVWSQVMLDDKDFYIKTEQLKKL